MQALCDAMSLLFPANDTLSLVLAPLSGAMQFFCWGAQLYAPAYFCLDNYFTLSATPIIITIIVCKLTYVTEIVDPNEQ